MNACFSGRTCFFATHLPANIRNATDFENLELQLHSDIEKEKASDAFSLVIPKQNISGSIK
jgi:hypothetical protein